MLGKIQVLPEPISQLIAAGEVIERPASVVKELMENAIDAGASEIVVELKAGGLQLIRVVDNGEGMSYEDAPVSLRRFATSKIRGVEDLYAIQTLGYRGEALPSIASVSKMTVKTRTGPSIQGTKVICEGGEIKSVSETGCPGGTEVEVGQLFYNLPARRKFLKSIRTELRYALQYFMRVALSHHWITFRFIHDGRTLQEMVKTKSSLVRLIDIMGREMADHLRPVEFGDSEIHLSGFVSLPSVSKGNPEGISLYVNRRYVKDRIVYKAILDAYRHINPSNHYPIVVLFISLPPSSVDINVHPAKAEVKFKEPEKIYQTVSAAIRGVLDENLPSTESPAPRQNAETASSAEGQSLLPFREERKPYFATPGKEAFHLFREAKESEEGWEASRGDPFRMIGQIEGTYVLFEAKGQLIFMDQHAAHERILFERLKKERQSRTLSSKKLIIPILMELSLEESLILDSVGEDFRAMGFEIEPAGEKLYAIGAIPSLIEQDTAKEMIRRTLEEMSFLRGGEEGSGTVQTLLVSLACHSAIRANYPLRREEMEELVMSLYPSSLSATCPHGRPIFFSLSLVELGKQFKRNDKRS